MESIAKMMQLKQSVQFPDILLKHSQISNLKFRTNRALFWSKIENIISFTLTTRKVNLFSKLGPNLVF